MVVIAVPYLARLGHPQRDRREAGRAPSPVRRGRDQPFDRKRRRRPVLIERGPGWRSGQPPRACPPQRHANDNGCHRSGGDGQRRFARHFEPEKGVAPGSGSARCSKNCENGAADEQCETPSQDSRHSHSKLRRRAHGALRWGQLARPRATGRVSVPSQGLCDENVTLAYPVVSAGHNM